MSDTTLASAASRSTKNTTVWQTAEAQRLSDPVTGYEGLMILRSASISIVSARSRKSASLPAQITLLVAADCELFPRVNAGAEA